MIHTVSLLDACREMARRMGWRVEPWKIQSSKFGHYVTDGKTPPIIHDLNWFDTGDGAFGILAWLDDHEEFVSKFCDLLDAWGERSWWTQLTPKVILELALTATDAEGRDWRVEG